MISVNLTESRNARIDASSSDLLLYGVRDAPEPGPCVGSGINSFACPDISPGSRLCDRRRPGRDVDSSDHGSIQRACSGDSIGQDAVGLQGQSARRRHGLLQDLGATRDALEN
jgi:hypothetical protein